MVLPAVVDMAPISRVAMGLLAVMDVVLILQAATDGLVLDMVTGGLSETAKDDLGLETAKDGLDLEIAKDALAMTANDSMRRGTTAMTRTTQLPVAHLGKSLWT